MFELIIPFILVFGVSVSFLDYGGCCGLSRLEVKGSVLMLTHRRIMTRLSAGSIAGACREDGQVGGEDKILKYWADRYRGNK